MLLQSIKNYLNTKSYNINISENYIYINNYKKVDDINEKYISIKVDNITLHIKGSEFKVSKMVDNEILLNGNIESIEFIHN